MSLIKLSEGNCKSCYKCVNSCAVKAIKMTNEQAEVVEDRCINCGHCVVVCPQEARTIENKVKIIKEALKDKRKVAVSIAPSFIAAFDTNDYGKIIAGIRKLGVDIVEETAVGAEIVSKLYNEEFNTGNYDNYITTSCPSVNFLIEKYYPCLIKYMAQVVSPMIAHGMMLKKIYGENYFTVFVGPCVSKQSEADDEQHKDAIDAVITFGELREWFMEEGIEINSLEPQEFDRNASKRGCSFPVLGGIANSIKIKNDEYEIIKVDGTEECMKLFESLKNGDLSKVCIEANICRGGCIGGPSMVKYCDSYYKNLKKVKEYIKKQEKSLDDKDIKIPENLNFSRKFYDKSVKRKLASEDEILDILKQMGKHEKSDELNCGGCGYNTCREKAQAVYEGMSEAKNCLPYIRSKAERLTNVIFEYSPNIILIVDKDMKVKEINPVGEEIFEIKADDIKNKPLCTIMDDSDFILAMESEQNIVSKKKFAYNNKTIVIESIMLLKKHGILLAIMRNITEIEKDKIELEKVKEKTLDGAQEVIEKQMRVAQEIASLLGETTAETKVILTKLKRLAMREIGD
jgi:iron only hydrogenase large subunit-like protein